MFSCRFSLAASPAVVVGVSVWDLRCCTVSFGGSDGLVSLAPVLMACADFVHCSDGFVFLFVCSVYLLIVPLLFSAFMFVQRSGGNGYGLCCDGLIL
jgi:hypothetical protein